MSVGRGRERPSLPRCYPRERELVDQTGVEPAKASPKGEAGLPDDRMER